MEIKEKELALKEQELALKEKELAAQKTTATTTISTLSKEQPKAISETPTKPVFQGNIENLLGCWAIPQSQYVNIQFSRDKKFRFNDFSAQGGEFLSGTYQLEGHDLLLFYDDRAKQKMYFYQGTGADSKNYYIKGYPLSTTKYYFVKNTPSLCK